MRTPPILLVALGVTLLPSICAATWQFNGTALTYAAGDQQLPAIASDGAGGAMVAWQDARSGFYDIYVQRIDALGVVQWTVDGVVLSAAAQNQSAPSIASDGAGGAIVTWHDTRSGNYDVYAQRIDAAGVVQWTADGVVVSNAADHQFGPRIVADGTGGAVVTWRDARNGNFDIYAQRIDAAGVVQWTNNGVAACTAANNQWSPTITTDMLGGAIVTWHDQRGGASDIYVQMIDALGAVQWTTDGVVLSAAADDQEFPAIVSDLGGGAIVTWQSAETGTYNIYAQRIDYLGQLPWGPAGVVVCAASSHQWSPAIASDNCGGAIVTWYDLRSGAYDIYAQLIDAAGVAGWTANGVALCTAANNQWSPTIAADGVGGAIVTWRDVRTGGNDIYAQRIDMSGSVLWPVNGSPVCASISDQETPVVVSDGVGGAVVAWRDLRRDPADIYAQRLIATGEILTAVGGRPLALQVGEVTPNPFAGTASLAFEAGTSPVRIDVFDAAGRAVRAMMLEGGSGRIQWDGRDQEGRLVPSGVYFCRVSAARATVTRKFVVAR